MLQWDSEKRCMQNVDKTYSFFTLFPEEKTIETFRGFFEVIFFSIGNKFQMESLCSVFLSMSFPVKNTVVPAEASILWTLVWSLSRKFISFYPIP